MVGAQSTETQQTGSIMWGHGLSERALFVSSESVEEADGDMTYDSGTGTHCAIRISANKKSCAVEVNFEATESGDAIALDPEGKN